MKTKTLLCLFVCSFFNVIQAQVTSPLFFSEYAEGTSNNKYLEIFNSGTEDVSLADYALARVSNAPSTPGEYETWSDVFPDDAFIAAGDVFVIAHSSADAIIQAQTDVTFNSLSNGDDGFALVQGTEDAFTFIDWIGDFNGDPGSGWPTCGVSNGTKDHTLVRNCDVSSGVDWSISSSEENCQWSVLDNENWNNLGSHTTCNLDISGCMDETASNYNSEATIDDGSCDFDDCVCSSVYDPVCGWNDVNYANSCLALCAGIDSVVPGECFVSVLGCTDPEADNYDENTNTDDGSCIVLTNSLSLQGVLDLSIPSSGGKAIHLVALEDEMIIHFGIGIAINGGGSDGQDIYIDTLFVNAGDDILLANDPESMNTYFGDCIGSFEHIIDVSLSINGNDAIELYEQGLVIETFGEVNVDGSGEAWDYLDSWAYKVEGEWTYGGVNCSDNSETTITSGCPYPICGVTNILGCMDPEAFNYNANATEDDGLCAPILVGCMSWSASNYDEFANTWCEDCCLYEGCTDSLALNFDSGANVDNNTCLYDNSSLTNALSLQGILDIGMSGNHGKAIHLVALADIVDLSIFGIGVANNGDGSDGQEYTFDAITVLSGENILLASSPDSLAYYLGNCSMEFNHVLLATSVIGQNGDDAIELFEIGLVIETFGDINVDGNGEDWEYTDSWAYKVEGEWTYGGVYCTEGSETTSSSNCPYPFCTAIQTGPYSQIISTPMGWSMFSTYMISEDPNFGSILDPITDAIVIVKNYLGNAYLPEWDFNGIGDISVGQGYQIKTTAPTSFEIVGSYAFPEDNPIDLTAGWNMIGYLRTDEVNIESILAEIHDDENLIIAKDHLGSAYLPEWDFNGIGDMIPGSGYQLKIHFTDVLQYLSNNTSYKFSSLGVAENNLIHFPKPSITDNNMTFVFEDAAWDVIPTTGDEIAAFDMTGNLVGSAVYSSPITVVTVWGNDPTTSSKDGLEVLEKVFFKIWSSDEVSDFNVSEWTVGFSSYNVDAINVASTIEINNAVTDPYFTDRVLVKVINALGQEVKLNDDQIKGIVLFNIYNDGSVEKFIE
jgi:hypothetical protein